MMGFEVCFYSPRNPRVRTATYMLIMYHLNNLGEEGGSPTGEARTRTTPPPFFEKILNNLCVA